MPDTKVDPAFEVCWNCGTTVDGVEDPSPSSTPTTPGPIDADPLFPNLTLDVG